MRPLEDIRVLDLSRFQACPLCGMILADMGAEVIRIEEPKGAPDRTWGQLGPDGETLLYKIVGRNKKSITLNLSMPEGKEIFGELVKRSDIVLHNFTPGAPMAKEIGYEHLKAIKASIIAVALSGYGQNGPDADKPCFDAVAQARSGGMILTGFPGSPPLKTTVTYIDVSTGLFATIGVLLALHHRDKTGQGQLVDVSLFDTAVFATQALGAVLLYELYGDVRKQVGNCGFHSYVGCFEVNDGWVIVGPATNTIWKRFVRAIGRNDMAEDARFLNDMDRFKHAPLIDSVVKEWGRSKTVAEVLAILQQARVPCSTVNTVRELLNDVQVKAREMVRYMGYPGLGKVPIPGIPIRLSLTPGSIDTPAPMLGEHNEEVYRELLGISLQKMDDLRKEGVI